MCLSLNGSGRQAGDYPPLEKQDHHDQRCGGNKRGRSNLPPRHRMFSLEEGDPHGHSLFYRVADNQKGKKKLIPRINKAQDGGRK